MRKILRDDDIQLVMTVLIGWWGPPRESWDYNEWIYFCFHFRPLKMHHGRPLPLPWERCQSNTSLRYHDYTESLYLVLTRWIRCCSQWYSNVTSEMSSVKCTLTFSCIIISSSSVLPGRVWAVPADGVSSEHAALWRPGGITAPLSAGCWFSCFRGGGREQAKGANARMR